MFKKIAVVMLSVAMCVPFGSVVMAEEDNSARIAEIEAQIAELEAELRELKGETGAEEGSVLYEDDEVIITYDGIGERTMGYEVKLVVENISDQKLTVQAREMSVNGFMVDPMCSIEVAPGKKAKDGIGVIGEDAEDNPMEEVESIETKFCIYRGDGFMDSYTTDSVVIK